LCQHICCIYSNYYPNPTHYHTPILISVADSFCASCCTKVPNLTPVLMAFQRFPF